jgi:ferricrocin synthase
VGLPINSPNERLFLIILQTYLPVDEDLPPARKALLLEDSESALILTTDAHAENFEQLKDRAVIERVNTIEHISRLAAQPSTLPQIEYNPAAPSYRKALSYKFVIFL